jgi:hypothetical protein
MTEARITQREKPSLLRLICCKCLHFKVLRVQVLPATGTMKIAASNSEIESASSVVGTANVSKRTIALNIPLRDRYVESESSVGASRRDSIQSVPNKPLHQYVFPRTPKHTSAMREATQ